MSFSNENTRYSRIKQFLYNNWVLIITISISGFLVFYNLGEIEFWGEDEAQTLLYASRFIMGLKHFSQANLTAFYSNATFSIVILLQVPFVLIFGVSELASRMPSAIVTILQLIILYKIGKLFLNKTGVNILLIIYAVSGAVGLFKSSINVGMYILFILIAFYNLELFLYSKNIDERGKISNLMLGLISLTFALISVPDAYLFIPFFTVIILINIKKIGAKKLIISLAAPLALFAIFIYLQFMLPRKLTGANAAAYTHFLGRKSGLELVFNIRELVFGYITNYSVYFIILFLISLVSIIILLILKKIKFPGLLIRMIFLFFVHFFVWMFLTKLENGHTMNSYPVFMCITAFGLQSLYDLFNKNNQVKVNLKKCFRNIMVCLFGILIILNFYHTFTIFNNLALDKSDYPLIYNPGRIPAGYNAAHKVGIKSAAYLLRQRKEGNERLVSDKGVAFNFIYMGGDFAPLAANNAIELMIADQDIVKDYDVRFIGISPDFGNSKYLEFIDSQGFDKIIIFKNSKELYYIYDIKNKNGLIEKIDRDEYDEKYAEDFYSVDTAIPYFRNF